MKTKGKKLFGQLTHQQIARTTRCQKSDIELVNVTRNAEYKYWWHRRDKTNENKISWLGDQSEDIYVDNMKINCFLSEQKKKRIDHSERYPVYNIPFFMYHAKTNFKWISNSVNIFWKYKKSREWFERNSKSLVKSPMSHLRTCNCLLDKIPYAILNMQFV